MTSPPRLRSAELLRAVATVFVVVIHTTHWPSYSPVYDTLDTLSRFAVPAFMLLTGVLLSYQYGARRVQVGDFLRRRFSRSLVPWLAWAPVYGVFGWFFSSDPSHSLSGIGGFLAYGAGHLWFLLLIPQMYVVFLVWPRRHLWWWAAAALAVQVALCVYRLYGPMPAEFVAQFFLWHGFQVLPFWIGYFAVGVAAGHTLRTRGEPATLRPVPVACAAAAVVVSGWLLVAISYSGAAHGDFVQGTGGFLLPQQPLFTFSIAVLVWLVGAPLLRRGGATASLSALLSDNSLGVYILHPMIVYAIARRLAAVVSTGLPLSLVGFLAITLGGLAGGTLGSVLLGWTPLAPTVGLRRRLPARRRAAAA